MKNLACILTLALSLTAIQAGKAHAEFVSGFSVVSVEEKTVTIKNKEGKQFVAARPAGELEVGDPVKFDKDTQKIKKVLEGC